MSADRGVTRQEETYVIWFGLLLGGNLTLGDNLWCLLVPQNRQKIGGGALIRDSALNLANTVARFHQVETFIIAESYLIIYKRDKWREPLSNELIFCYW